MSRVQLLGGAGAITPRRPWKGRRVVLGVTGGIAAFKAVQVARDLTRLGAEVDVILTRAARKFVTPLSFEGVTGRRALTDLFSAEGAALHVRLAQEADVVCVAPAGADFLARAAHGRADDLIGTTLIATTAPVLICPAMNDRMFAHPQVQDNLTHVRERLGYRIAGPALGPLAAGEGEGPGRLLEPWQIEEAIGRALTEPGPFDGARVLVTAGPTHEAIDPVRHVANRSSGRMGYAVAQAAWRRGAEVCLVSGPSCLDAPFGVDVVSVESALQMRDAVAARIHAVDVSVFAAAVSDYRPEDAAEGKLKRGATGPRWQLEMVENPDIALETAGARSSVGVSVGFALETDDLIANARAKLQKKAFDLVVANDPSEADAGFGVETNRVTIVTSRGALEELPLMSKAEVAEEILDRAGGLLADKRSGSGVGEAEV